MGFRLHKKGNNDFSASDSDSVLTTPARFQVAADAAAAAQERSWFKAHKNSVDSSAGGCGGYRGSTGRQGHSSVDLTDKLSMSYTLFSSSASTLPMAPGSGYSAGSSSSSSALSGSPDPFAYSNGVQPNAISLGQQQQQQQQQQQPTLPPQAGLGSSPARLPSFSVLTRPASVAAIPHVSPPIAVPSSIALGTSGGGGGGGGGSGSAAAAAAVIALSGDKRPTKLFGTPLGCLPMGSGKQTPKVLRFFLKNMVKTNVAGTPNVFKRGGKAPLIAAFKKELDSGTFNYNTDPYVSADVFKLWIRSLPEPLVPKSL